MSNTMSDELVSNLVDFCENRLRVYAMLSRCFEKELDAAFAEELATKVAFASDDAALAEGFSLLQSDLAKRDEPALEQLAVAFNRVFFGMGPRAAQKAFPYESVYTSERGLMMQEAYNQVLRIYRASGFAKDPKFTEPEDHLAVEFVFMAKLCEQTVRTLRAGDEETSESSLREQLAFAREHLLNWLPRFVRDMEAAAEEGFYRHLALFVVAFVRADVRALEEVVE